MTVAGTKLRVLDLFSGIGGFSLGLERAKLEGAQYDGFKTVAFCEIEEYPRSVLAKHWPDAPCYTDVRELTGKMLEDDGIGTIDVITGGFPCQDISLAGKQAGIKDGNRSGLWSEIVRLVGELRPKFVIVENVANLLAGPSERRGGWFGRVLGDLAECGYDAEWENIPAGAMGAPHRRERIWIVAYPNGERCGQYYGPTITIPALIAGYSNDLGFEGWQTPWERHLEALCRVDDGLRGRMDKLGFQALGNAVVPQIPELIGRAILQSLNAP